jgi:hypothetical protein
MFDAEPGVRRPSERAAAPRVVGELDRSPSAEHARRDDGPERHQLRDRFVVAPGDDLLTRSLDLGDPL